jgi:phage regulator Rha-like protein
MLRMTYTVEVVKQLQALHRITLSEHQQGAVQLEANTAINVRDAQWHGKFLATLADASGKQMQDICRDIEHYVGLTDAIK